MITFCLGTRSSSIMSTSTEHRVEVFVLRADQSDKIQLFCR